MLGGDYPGSGYLASGSLGGVDTPVVIVGFSRQRQSPPGSGPTSGPKGSFKRRPSFDTVPRPFRVLPISGPSTGGTAVTITGQNFHYNSDGTLPQVFFGDLAATSVVVVDQFTITAVTPASLAAGTVDIRIVYGAPVVC